MKPEELLNAEVISALVAKGISAGANVFLAAAILIIGMIVAGVIRKVIRAMALNSKRIDDTLGGFFASIAYYAIMAIVLIAVLDKFGVPTTWLVAALGAQPSPSVWLCKAHYQTLLPG